ncbi:MAG: bacteriohemerythrin [Gammaproteobacteria bacterium]|nr:bacteriohemerythrin [Gammaproteobacteria bacterium]
MLWQWDESLSVGINVIDAQHKRIVQYINELATARDNGDRATIGKVLDGMIDYTVTHFAFEESLMERAGYPILREHKMVHDNFTRRILNHKNQFEAGGDIGRQLFSDLQMWLTNHIKRDDKDYTPAVRQVIEEKSWVSRMVQKMFG